ncbi:hypothetical protein RHSIM_Rhsim01G0196600 [Rhododendron simsii]|uniref:Ribosomal protein eL8/eL30/eS12/Gadd45 domain-containing protein n=1 Tax=Rhododendron simsii TaxID=118357 RepID=A0A834HHN5_RHOSS|nr:hypothetical protein RHSIM_Rhsim01G0196600 [Rhododendron simsii]
MVAGTKKTPRSSHSVLASRFKVSNVIGLPVEGYGFRAHADGVKCILLFQKRTHESINSRLALVMKSGKYTLGSKTVLETLRNSKGCFQILLVWLLTLNVSVLFVSDNVDLGTACGKYFRVCCLSVIDPGDSDIIKSMPTDH